MPSFYDHLSVESKMGMYDQGSCQYYIMLACLKFHIPWESASKHLDNELC